MSQYYHCCDQRRRDFIAGRSDLNGIDFLEVLDSPSLPLEERQRTLFVHFINDPTGLALETSNVRLSGGERVRSIAVSNAALAVDPRSGETDRPVLVVDVDQRGDFSTYTLSLEEDAESPGSLAQIDPVLRAVDFSFKVNCPNDYDCQSSLHCPANASAEPSIDYLARDYQSFRQLLLDRMAITAPQWSDRSPADLGVTLVELYAYLGDQLSYRQDAVSAEAYLGTARQRVSVRRHARLVDYFMHEGCNARAWLHFRIDPAIETPVTIPSGTQALTAVANQPPLLPPGSTQLADAFGSGAETFETMRTLEARSAHNTMRFYTWGARQCCLPKGAVKASLRGAYPELQAGDFLLFREEINPRTGDPDEAAFEHRHVVMLTDVSIRQDPLGGLFDDPPEDAAREVTDIRWADEDALPFPLCVSAELDESFGAGFVEDVTLVYGNIALADHGLTLSSETLPPVPKPTVARLAADANGSFATEADHCAGSERRLEFAPARYAPRLNEGPLTHAAPLPDGVQLTSARPAEAWEVSAALPEVWLASLDPGSVQISQPWQRQRDLLASGPDDRHFVVEIDNRGRAYLRFGDGNHGARPTPGTIFEATYRIGNGPAGNVGAETLVHLVSNDSRILSVTNPIPARGGHEPESLEEVRQRAPHAFFEDQKRAVTPTDYANHASNFAGVQRAVATQRWTGSWYTLFVSADRMAGAPIDDEFDQNLRAHLEPLRMAGHDLEIEPPQLVALEVTFRVVVRDDYFRSDVEQALKSTFTSGIQPDGRLGVFHPDKFTFGQTVYLSPWVAAAQAIPGVSSVTVARFQRRDEPGETAIDTGFIAFERLEVPVLENNSNFPERGTFEILTEGGK